MRINSAISANNYFNAKIITVPMVAKKQKVNSFNNFNYLVSGAKFSHDLYRSFVLVLAVLSSEFLLHFLPILNAFRLKKLRHNIHPEFNDISHVVKQAGRDDFFFW